MHSSFNYYVLNILEIYNEVSELLLRKQVISSTLFLIAVYLDIKVFKKISDDVANGKKLICKQYRCFYYQIEVDIANSNYIA